jgi:roadblock/LC7 domain-containing protein
MTKLDELLKMDGVVAAGEFTTDGKMVEFKSSTNMPQEMASMTAQFCATMSMTFNTLAGAYSRLTGTSWTPQQGWAYTGGDMTVAVGGNVGVFIRTENADFNKLFKVLVS